ncbi:hypothetical protein H072_4995 [Dactylellina haptotyla CBS 200.50]|uniref:F-box domain-containing protein n=1 Tax=Dactylellina haptotyla (strain CBS 200.50) TaxID=1284197 RepID=S8BNQ7_DACHA|nr:hypothetical protein H072_4995 [Dactylellina haptotyla CBS 200.50]
MSEASKPTNPSISISYPGTNIENHQGYQESTGTTAEAMVHPLADLESYHRGADYENGNDLALVRRHYGFVPYSDQDPSAFREPPAWHGPFRNHYFLPVGNKPVWWSKREISDLCGLEELSISDDGKNHGEFLLGIFQQPDPIARIIASFLHIADLNSLKYTCRNFKNALSETGAWAWMLREVTFGNQHTGATDAFNGLRRIRNRLSFYDHNGITSIIQNLNAQSVIISVDLDKTCTNAATIYWLLKNLPRLNRISVRHCQTISLEGLYNALQQYATEGGGAAQIRLRETYIDYWNTPEIYGLMTKVLVNQASLPNVRRIADKIRHIAKFVRSNVFLCHRNHYQEGLLPELRSDSPVEENAADTASFFPCEIKSVECTLCGMSYDKRFCLRCWQTQICAFCKEFHCANCEPEDFENLGGEKNLVGSMVVLKINEPCCSHIPPVYSMKHYFHSDCWVEATQMATCSGCRKFKCTAVPTRNCPMARCGQRQCSSGRGYSERKCQFCKMDFAYGA